MSIDLSNIELVLKEYGPVGGTGVVDPLQVAEVFLKTAVGILADVTVKNYDEKIQKLTIRELAFLMKQAQDLDTMAKDIKAVFYKLFEHVRINVLPDRMEEEGYEGGLKITDLGRINLTADVRASIPAVCRKEAYEWLCDHGHDLVTETVNAASLKALARRLLRDNDPLPEDYFKVVPYTRASITKV